MPHFDPNPAPISVALSCVKRDSQTRFILINVLRTALIYLWRLPDHRG